MKAERWEEEMVGRRIREHLEQDQIPEGVHAAVVQVCAELPETTQRRHRPLWRPAAVTLCVLVALFAGLCGTNAVNPAFAESIPLIGEAFRQYNHEKKVSVGTYVGTYGVNQINSQAQGNDAGELKLTAEEAYSDGEYLHLSFFLKAPEEYLKRYRGIDAPTEAEINGKKLETAGYLNLVAAENGYAGTIAYRLDAPVENGTELVLRYSVSGLLGSVKEFMGSEELEGSFSGTVTVTADTTHNRTLEVVGGGEIKVSKIEATPSYTRIDYEIPFWGIGGWLTDYPRLYLPDGTPVRSSLDGTEADTNVPRDAKTLTSSRFFDGLPKGTKQVVLRFLDEDADDENMAYLTGSTGDEFIPKQAGVLGEVTIDLSTGKAVPSETYKAAGLSFASGYLEDFFSLNWSVVFDDLFLRSDIHNMRREDVFDTEDLFQNGFALEQLDYSKEKNRLTANFYSPREYEKDWEITVAGEDGRVKASGTVKQENVYDHDRMTFYDTEEEMRAADEKEIADMHGAYDTKEREEEQIKIVQEWAEKTYPGQYSYKVVMTPITGQEPKLLDTLTVCISDPDTGETVYERAVRLVRK